jgi:hypothetical protein
MIICTVGNIADISCEHFQESKDKNKRQPINVRDDFWHVTAQKKVLVDKYFKVRQSFFFTLGLLKTRWYRYGTYLI